MALLNWGRHDWDIEKNNKNINRGWNTKSWLGQKMASTNSFRCEHDQMDKQGRRSNFKWKNQVIRYRINRRIEINCHSGPNRFKWIRQTNFGSFSYHWCSWKRCRSVIIRTELQSYSRLQLDRSAEILLASRQVPKKSIGSQDDQCLASLCIRIFR